MKKLTIDRLERSPLPFIVKDRLEQVIKNRNLTPGSKLPSENELANMLAVSRSSLREALSLLEEDGLIIRRHGVGTFVRGEISLMRNPLEINFGVTEIIESMGLRAGTAKVEIEHDKANSFIAEKLRVDTGSAITFIKRLRTANEKPVVYTIDIIPEATLGKIEIPSKFTGSLYHFLEEKYNQKIDYGIAKIIPTLAESEISEQLGVTAKSVILLINQLDYNVKNQPILYSQEYWRKDICEFTIFRRRR